MMNPGSKAGSAGAQIIALPELHSTGNGVLPEVPAMSPMLGDWSALQDLRVRLQVCVGEATLRVGDLLSATPGRVLPLDRRIDDLVDLCVDGKVVARGMLVAVDGQFGFRISELPVPPMPRTEGAA